MSKGDQKSLIHIKSDIEISKDRIFLIKHIAEGSTRAICYSVQVDMDQYDPIIMRYFGV